MLSLLAALALQAAAPPPAPPVVSATAPDAAADQAVRTATDVYLAARDAGRYDQAWAMLSPDWQARRPHDPWVAAAREFNSQAGASRGRRIAAVTWLENPGGGITGTFGVVEYNGDYADLVFMCGVAVWERQPDGAWRPVPRGHARRHAGRRAQRHARADRRGPPPVPLPRLNRAAFPPLSTSKAIPSEERACPLDIHSIQLKCSIIIE